jgi:tripartite-type tricarboxylate transporter receptor subunit TctC
MNTPPIQPGRRHTLCLGLASAAALAVPSVALGQGFPNKPVRIVVGFPPGGVADVFARSIQPSLQEHLGQPVVIENRAGANGNLAADFVAKSPGDGYTLVLSSTGIETVNPLMLPRSFDPQKDLQAVALLGDIQLFLVTKQQLPPNSLQEFLAYAKANVGKLSYGSAGSGSTPHLAGELFKQATGIFATHIPYRGAAPALQDLLAGQIDYYFDPGIAFPHVRAGRLKMHAVASRKRSKLFPNVPTLLESGIRGVEADTLFGLWAPASTPQDVVARLNREVNKSLALPAVRERFAGVGGDADPVSVAEFRQKIQAEAATFGAIIKARNIKAD